MNVGANPQPSATASRAESAAEPAAGASVGARWALRERWFACSNALGWAAPAEWPHPTVDEVCAAVVSGASPAELEPALAAWGGARAAAGIGLAETLTDLAALHTAVIGGRGEFLPGDSLADEETRGPEAARLVRAVSLAWTDVACGELADTAVLDPLSGLLSPGYLRVRLREVYAHAASAGRRPGEGHALVAVTMSVAGWSRVAPLSVAGTAAATVFDAGESIVSLGRATLLVLAPRDGLAPRVRVLRKLVTRRLDGAPGLLAPPRVRTLALPASVSAAQRRVDELVREAGR